MDLRHYANPATKLLQTHHRRFTLLSSPSSLSHQRFIVRSSIPSPAQHAKYNNELRAAVDAVDRACRLCVDVSLSSSIHLLCLYDVLNLVVRFDISKSSYPHVLSTNYLIWYDVLGAIRQLWVNQRSEPFRLCIVYPQMSNRFRQILTKQIVWMKYDFQTH